MCYWQGIRKKRRPTYGDTARVEKTEGGQTVVYVNQYYEKTFTKQLLDFPGKGGGPW